LGNEETRLKKIHTAKKGVSPVIAVLLMIAIAVAAAILVYVWSMGLIGTLTSGGGTQVREQIIMDAYDWKTQTGTLVMFLRNVGSTDVVVDAIYIGGQPISSGMDQTLQLQTVVSVPLGATGTYTPGVAYTAKIITKTGGVFTFQVIYGSAT